MSVINISYTIAKGVCSFTKKTKAVDVLKNFSTPCDMAENGYKLIRGRERSMGFNRSKSQETGKKLRDVS